VASPVALLLDAENRVAELGDLLLPPNVWLSQMELPVGREFWVTTLSSRYKGADMSPPRVQFRTF
jgi:hypothetical protein